MVFYLFYIGIYLTFKVTADVPVTHVAANTDSTVPSPAMVTISCNQCFSVSIKKAKVKNTKARLFNAIFTGATFAELASTVLVACQAGARVKVKP